jgi:hypothetical protein
MSEQATEQETVQPTTETIEQTPVESKETDENQAKQLSQIADMVTYWFGNSNYPRDKFLQTNAALDNGWINISVFTTFNKMKAITTDVAFIAEGAKLSPVVVVSEDGLKIKKKDSLPEDFSFDGRVVLITGFAESDEQSINTDSIQSLFPGEGKKLLSVRVGRDLKKKFNKSVEVEFATVETAAEVLAQGNLNFGESKLVLALKKTSKSDEKQRMALKKNRKDEKEKDEEKEEAARPDAIPWDTISYNTLIKITGLPESKKARFECESFFNKFGKVKHTDAGFTNETAVIVRFAEEDAARQALKSLEEDNKQLGGHPVESGLITGDDEITYWKSFVLRDPSTQSARGGRGGKGGRGGRGGRGGGGFKKQRTEQ